MDEALHGADTALVRYADDFVILCRSRIAALLEAHAVRVQESVFEARLTTAQRERLQQQLTAHVGPGDSIRLYVIPDAAVADACVIGAGRAPEKGPFLIF